MFEKVVPQQSQEQCRDKGFQKPSNRAWLSLQKSDYVVISFDKAAVLESFKVEWCKKWGEFRGF